ncbi:MAG: amino acid ABC transporter substrate-binding protein [Thaumarchaeota archaeon]|nr:MAG: amino acid ABC transporter substrate-binding protein [Nitrososphaerota archaeon]
MFRMAAQNIIAVLVIGLLVGAGVGYAVPTLLAPPAATTGTKTYTIGIVFPLTGTLADFGKSFVNAVNLAVDQMNENLTSAGSSIRFKTVVQDDKGTPAGALSAVQAIYQSSSAQLIIGPLTTSEVLGARDYANTNKIVLLPPASSGTAASFPILPGVPHYLFRPGQPGDNFEGSALAQLAVLFQMKNIVYLYRADSSGSGKYNFTKGLLAQAGIQQTGIQIPPDQNDYSSVVSTASSDVAQVISSGGSYATTAVMIDDYGKEAQNIFTHASTDPQLTKVRWIGVEALNDNTLLSNPTTGAFISLVKLTITTAYTPSSPQGRVFLNTFKAKYGSPPEPFSNYAYDVTWVGMLSVLATGVYSGPAIVAVLPQVANHYFGASGTPTFLDKNGDQAIAYFAIDLAFQNGTAYAYKQIGLYDGAANKVTLTGG